MSASVTGSPPISIVSRTMSRVVPGIGVTIARSLPTSRLSSVDLPAFGRPRITALKPARRRAAAAVRLRHRRDVAQRVTRSAPRFVAGDELVALFREIERRLQPRDHVEQRLPDRRRLPAQHPFEIRQRQLRLQRRARVDQIRDRLRLHEIELAVEHRALGELARLRHPRAERHARRDHPLDEQRIAVQRQLDEIVAGERVRRLVADGDAFVDRPSVASSACACRTAGRSACDERRQDGSR